MCGSGEGDRGIGLKKVSRKSLKLWKIDKKSSSNFPVTIFRFRHDLNLTFSLIISGDWQQQIPHRWLPSQRRQLAGLAAADVGEGRLSLRLFLRVFVGQVR